MKLTSLVAGFYVSGALAINCKNHNVLSNYRIAESVLLVEDELDTSPSKTHDSWFINPCEQNGEKERPSECQKQALVCGLERVNLDKKDFLTQSIAITQGAKYEIEELGDTVGVLFKFKEVKWGNNVLDAIFEFQCDSNLKKDELVYSTWRTDGVDVVVKGPSGCKRDGKDNDNGGNNDSDNGDEDKKKKPQKSSSWSMSIFGSLFIWALLFTGIYLLVISYLNTRGGSFNDFRDEFNTRSAEFITSLPKFIKEVVNKVLGNRQTTADHGGYSAV